MDVLLKRLNADNRDHYAAMLIYAMYFNLPFVAEDLVEYMSFGLIKKLVIFMSFL